MAVVEFVALTEAVSDAEPCGSDLDLNGDADFMNFMARAEGLVPSSYFSGPDGQPFDRSIIDLAAEARNAQPFLAQTRDLRLLVLLAKFAVLSRDLDSFVACVRAIHTLLETRWDEVHPRGEGGDFTARTAVLETLNDNAPVVIPLQFAPLVQGKRAGVISYRMWMMANGEVPPREGEDTADRTTIEKALMEAELDVLIALRGQFEALHAALTGIVKICGERAGSGQSVNLDRVLGLVGKVFGLLNDVITKRDPSAAAAGPVLEKDEAGEAATPVIPAGLIRSNADVAAALAAIDGYFCRFEPSNPALLLVRQAQQLMGKSFLEVMQILVPAQVAEAKFRIGNDHPFEIPIESLSPLAAIEVPEGGYTNGQDASGHDAGEQDVGNQDASGEGDTGQDASGGESAGESQANNSTSRLSASTRQEAFALLDQIGVYYRLAEPSSPISFITERARSYINRDFVALLKDLLPAPPSS